MDYSAWRRQNNFRFEIKERLDFLQKAKALHLPIDTSGKYVIYLLTDQQQQRPVRDRTLSKKASIVLIT